MKGSCFFSFLGGAAIGAMIALLTAPDSGANTRHKIAGKIKQGGQKVKDTLGAGDSLIASFLTGFIGRTKAGMDKETAICESLEEAAAFAAGICGMEGAFGYGKKYE